MCSTLYLVRHAASVGQAPEDPLSPTGVVQAQKLAKSLEKIDFDAVYASPFERATATAEPIASHRNLKIPIIPDLRERLLASHWLDNWRDHLKRSFCDPDYKLDGAESTNEATKRALNAIAQITNAGNIRPLAVTHGNLLACIFRSIDQSFGYDDWAEIGNGVCFEVTVNNGKPVEFQRLKSS